MVSSAASPNGIDGVTRLLLAQINNARTQAPLDDPCMSAFTARLASINRLAEESPGFVWRLQGEEGDATALRVFADPMLLVNMSVWESYEALKTYVYRSAHRELLRDRQRWFGRLETAHLALWWIPAGTLPGLEEARERLALIAAAGPGPGAFTFSTFYPPPASDASAAHR